MRDKIKKKKEQAKSSTAAKRRKTKGKAKKKKKKSYRMQILEEISPTERGQEIHLQNFLKF